MGDKHHKMTASAIDHPFSPHTQEDPAFSVPCFVQCPSKSKGRSTADSITRGNNGELGFGVDCTTMDRVTIQRRKEASRLEARNRTD